MQQITSMYEVLCCRVTVKLIKKEKKTHGHPQLKDNVFYGRECLEFFG